MPAQSKMLTAWIMLSAASASIVGIGLFTDLMLPPAASAVAPAGVPDASSVNESDGSKEIVGAPSSDALAAIMARPLFSPSRRPPPSAPPPSAPAAPKLTAKLIGTMVTGSFKLALLKTPGRDVVTLSLGDDIGGWVVREIASDQVSLELDGRVRRLSLQKDLPRPSAEQKRGRNRVERLQQRREMLAAENRKRKRED